MSALTVDAASSGLVHRMAAEAPVGASLTCSEGQSAVFLQWGRVAGALGPGEHVLDPQTHPFLSLLVQQGPSGPVIAGEILFVNTKGKSFEVASGAATASVSVRIAEPEKAVGELAGSGNAEAVDEWVRSQLAAALKDGAPQGVEAALAGVRAAFEQVGLALSVDAGSAQEVSPVAPAGIAVGSRVRTSQGGTWYSGSVARVDGGQCEIAWDGSGQKTWVPQATLEPEPSYPGAHAAGTRVLAQWPDGAFYPATVRVFNGTSYEIAWENGQTAWLAPGQIKLA